ncbi:N-6 DNA methylase [Paenibacillus sp. JNUCC31]|uniref:Eco57I restriction-modification methylase domain-containing protein n=1 Tax=Paenibacillus sp. JNUCC-31 TaxID=2777983 RepID=UPI00177DA19F|nr:N-6 DNA methylase [Paenibacillus sp. JNUCC-31]QOS77067.1 N-6 DNA methylase [Paenibacillus sp. JNUCC-31]
MEHKKKNGVYYTPDSLANFVINHLYFNFLENKKKINVLEPSCGDGIFINAIVNSKTEKKQKLNITAVELDELEIGKISQEMSDKVGTDINITFHNRDYLEFQVLNKDKYDLIIGNPPYISHKHLTEHQISLSNEVLTKAKVSPPRTKNLWISFLISSVLSLTNNGTICFILPSELLQVKHSLSIRDFLFKHFNYIEIFTFGEIVFEGIEQDTIIFIGSNSKGKRGFKYSNIDNLKDLNIDVINESENLADIQISEKWTSLILTNSHIDKLTAMKERVYPLDFYCSSGAGIVTAANKSFIVDDNLVEKYKLEEFKLPIIQKSSQIKNLINFTKNDFEVIQHSGKPTNLLLFKDQDYELFTPESKLYLDLLVKDKVHQRYKCTKRNRWYVVPSVWKSDGFFFKRSFLHPKIIVNDAEVLVTDTAYRITMKEGYDIKSLAFSFYNSLTLVFTELFGRYYGGGVLELTPNEFKKVPIPYVNVTNEVLIQLDDMFRDEEDFSKILTFTNDIVLKQSFGFTNDEIEFLNTIRERLINRRLKRY